MAASAAAPAAASRVGAANRAGSTGPAERRGARTTGRINRLFVGQSHGFIRCRDGREVFFHRSDVDEGTSFNAFEVGDPVAFELLEDAVSGARAIKVKRRAR